MRAPVPDAAEARDNAAFAALMWAMARPGSIQPLPGGVTDLALALVDGACRATTDDAALAKALAAAGAALVPAGEADHAFITQAAGVMAALASLPAGSALHPEAGATLALPVTLGHGARLRLSGPGVDGARVLTVAGLPDGMLALRAARCRYPEGVDLVLIDGARIAALPRSTRVELC